MSCVCVCFTKCVVDISIVGRVGEVSSAIVVVALRTCCRFDRTHIRKQSIMQGSSASSPGQRQGSQRIDRNIASAAPPAVAPHPSHVIRSNDNIIRRVFELRADIMSAIRNGRPSSRNSDRINREDDDRNEDVMVDGDSGEPLPSIPSSSLAQHVLSWDASFIRDRIVAACTLANELRIAPGNANGSGEQRDSSERAKGVLSRCLELLYYTEQTVSLMKMTTKSLEALPSNAPIVSSRGRNDDEDAFNEDMNEGDESLAPVVFRFVPIDENVKTTSAQRLILYVLNVVFLRGYCRCGDDCYERLFLPSTSSRAATNGVIHDTKAWKRVCSLRDLIYDVTKKEMQFDQWLNLTQNKCNAQAVIDYMTHCSDSQFPSLVKNRHMFSFRNGIYVTAMDAVFNGNEFQHMDIRTRRESLKDAFIPYGSQKHAELPPHVASCRFIDEIFPIHDECYGGSENEGGEDWYHRFRTPFLQSIMDYQRFDEQVCRWMYVMIGRLLYEQGDFDGWQVLPFLKGQASSGKSTIVYMCRNMFEPSDVGMLSNNIERKFGISSFYDKYLFVAPEIKSDLQLEQAEFQSMVSGESVQVAFKFRDARTVDWKVPGIMAGNEVPGWIDNSGSISRRIVVFEFMRKVVDGDMELKNKLQRELPSIILKCNRAYHEAVRACGSDNIWNHLPEYFRRTKEELTESTNPITHFMNSGKLQYGDPQAYMPMDTLKRAFQAHCEENNFRKMRLTKDKFEPAMFEFGLTLEKNNNGISRRYPRPVAGNENNNNNGDNNRYGRMECHKEWCMGADLTANHNNNNNNSGGGDNVFENGNSLFFS